jgi:hypothetical protein
VEAGTRSLIPYAGRTVIALAPEQFAAIRGTVAALFRIAHSPAYARLVDSSADALARFSPGNFGVFMGYDFHLTPEGPRLIEVNTNAGGALLNGLHTASLCDPARLSCLCEELLAVETIQQRIARTFASEFEAVRPGRPLSRIAIADEHPREQFLYPEFELFVQLFEQEGMHAAICDTSELARGEDRLNLRGERVDLVYLRDTDFMLAAPRSAAVRAAYLAREAVVTPSPREHHLLANKRRLELFSSPEVLERLGASGEDARLLTAVVPETRALCDMDLEHAWRERGDWVFKPCSSFGSRGVYRGDKISRRKFEQIALDPGFLAQRRVAPGTLEVETSEGPRAMKFDVRAYAYRDEVFLLGARIYEGQVTNLRSPGGGFSAICVARSAAGRSAPGAGYRTCPEAP